MIRKSVRIAGALALAAVSSVPAHAAEELFLNGSSSNGTSGNVRTYSFVDGSTLINAQATGWSVDSMGVIRQGALGRWDGGLGVIYNSNDNSHTVDNSGRTDFVVFQFSQAVDLNRINLTAYGDTDATIRYGNVGGLWNANPGLHLDPMAQLLALTPNSFAVPGGNSSGWRNVNGSNATANWWVISAAAPNPDSYKDYFKIKALDLTAAAVPEPSTWMMMILGIGAIGAASRKRQQAVRLAAAV